MENNQESKPTPDRIVSEREASEIRVSVRTLCAVKLLEVKVRNEFD
jgi:hypothetical protein